MNGFPHFLLSLVSVLLYFVMCLAWVIMSIRIAEGHSKSNGGYHALTTMTFTATGFVFLQLYFGTS